MGEAAKTMAQVHAEKAEKLLSMIDGPSLRSTSTPAGATTARMANAHALLALYYQGNAT